MLVAEKAESPYMTQAEAAAYLKVSRWTLIRYVEQGLRQYGTGRGQRFRKEDLDQFMQNKT